ncbi:MAG TPA: DR2241 family protein [Chthoniobacterales bacterium]|jgi:sirohydrochlorin cobaltochelatase
MPQELQLPVRLPETEDFTFGQILIQRVDGGRFRLRHRDDQCESDPKLRTFRNPENALEISRFDDNGNYRALKTAPNLSHGWQLEVASGEDLSRALDHFYPGRLAMFAAHTASRLRVTSLRETLSRQSGMYRTAAKVSDQQLDDLVGSFCRSDTGCLRTILWKRDASGMIPSSKLPPEKFDPVFDQARAAGVAVSTPTHFPLLCQEACNLLVAECRKAVKGETDS